MITRLRTGLLATALLSATCLFTGCSMSGVDGTGPVVRQARTVDGFTKVRVELSGKMEVRQGAAFKVEIEAEQNLQDLIESRVEGSTLVIKSKKNIGTTQGIHYFVTMPELEGVTIAGSGNVQVLDIFSPRSLELDVQGSGDINGTFIAGKVEADIAGSGNIGLKGSATRLEVDIAGSGDVNALDMAAKEVSVDVAGSGDVTVSVADELSVDIAGSGSVSFKGDPKKMSQEVNGSGKVKKI